MKKNTPKKTSKREWLEPDLFKLDSNIFEKLAAEPLSFVQELRRRLLTLGQMRLFLLHL